MRPPRRRSVLRAVLVGLLVLTLVVGLSLGLLWLNRRMAAREVLVGWLDRRGIAADVEVERLELDGFIGRLRVGDPDDPDVVVERVEVDYGLSMPWAQGGLGVTPTRIRLVRPVLVATWREGRLSLGSLDPLIDEFRNRPPSPRRTAPIILVEGGRLRLTTEYGPVEVLGQGRMEDNRLLSLDARMPAAALKSGSMAGQGIGGTLTLRTVGDRMAVTTELQVETLETATLAGRALHLSAEGELPYPDLERRQGDGRVRLRMALAGDRLSLAGTQLGAPRLDATFDGETRGWIQAYRITGRTTTKVAAEELTMNGLGSSDTRLTLPDADLSLARGVAGLGWRLAGPATLASGRVNAAGLTLGDATMTSSALVIGGRDHAVELTGPVSFRAAALRYDSLDLRGVVGRFDLDATQQGPMSVSAGGSLSATSGAWPLLGAAASDDVPELADMKRALGRFRLDIPDWSLLTGSSGTEVRLRRAARIAPANGGVLTLQPRQAPLFAAEPGGRGGGALTLVATRGAGLPEGRFEIPDWRQTAQGFTADLAGIAALDFGVARGLRLQTQGTLDSTAGQLTFRAPGCTPFTVERLELGENDAESVSGSVCQTDRPLVVVGASGWQARGRLVDTTATLPFLMTRIEDAAGDFVTTGASAGLALDATIAAARLVDLAEVRRVYDLTASGRAGLEGDRWTGRFDLARGGVTLGRATLTHTGGTQAGGVVIDVPQLTFVDGGLQPDDLTPLLADMVTSPVRGDAAFHGRFDWSPAGETSGGRLALGDLDFASPLGPVEGLNGDIVFDSLAPLDTAPGQRLTVRRLDAFADLSDLEVGFDLDATAMRIDGGSVQAAGGTIRVEPFDLPLDRTQPINGVIVLDRIQLGRLISEAGFGDRVEMDAVVSGRLPFVETPEGVRIEGGSLAAVEPGRLSIKREAVVGLEAGGGGEVPPNAVEDLAYQALENLAFDILNAEVNSLEEGRLGVLFRIRGRHDPPQRQELRVGLMDFVTRRFLQRELPLPSDTGIDLTLDTTLNLNQLVGDILAVNRARAGEAEP